MNSIAPWSLPGHLARSEAFAEDLAEHSSFEAPQRPRVPMLSATLLCAVPVAVALLGGVAAFIHTMG